MSYFDQSPILGVQSVIPLDSRAYDGFGDPFKLLDPNIREINIDEPSPLSESRTTRFLSTSGRQGQTYI